MSVFLGTGSLNVSNSIISDNEIIPFFASITSGGNGGGVSCGSTGGALPGEQINFDSSGSLSITNTTFGFTGGNATKHGGTKVQVAAPIMGELVFGEDVHGSCPRGDQTSVVLASTLEVMGFPFSSRKIGGSFVSISCISCPIDTYSLTEGVFSGPNALEDVGCMPCPEGGDCAQGGRFIRPQAGMWGYNFTLLTKQNNDSSSSNLGEDYDVLSLPKLGVQFISCPIGYCCSANGADVCSSYDFCSGNRSGELCGQCKLGFCPLIMGTGCINCTECSIGGQHLTPAQNSQLAGLIILFVLVVLVLFYLASFMYSSTTCDSTWGFYAITIFFFQVLVYVLFKALPNA